MIHKLIINRFVDEIVFPMVFQVDGETIDPVTKKLNDMRAAYEKLSQLNPSTIFDFSNSEKNITKLESNLKAMETTISSIGTLIKTQNKMNIQIPSGTNVSDMANFAKYRNMLPAIYEQKSTALVPQNASQKSTSLMPLEDSAKAVGPVLRTIQEQLDALRDASSQINFNISTKGIENSESKLKNLLSIMDTMKASGSSLNIGNNTELLKTAGIFDTLPSSIKNTISSLSSLESIAVNQPNEFSEIRSAIQNTINSLDAFNTANIKESSCTETAAAAVRDAGNEISNTKNKTDNATNSTNKYSKAWTNTKKVLMGLGINASLTGIVRQMVSMVEETAIYEESLNLFKMSFGSFADQATEWSNKISSALYLDPSDVMQMSGSFYTLAKGLNVSSEDAYKMATNLTQLTYDMSSYRNVSVSAANTKLMSAMSGQTKAVTEMGIAVQSASLQEFAYSVGINKSVESMDQAEKTYLRYLQIMNSTKQMQGDLGRTIITPANSLRLLQTQLKLAARALGEIFTPVIMYALPFIIAMTSALQDFAHWLASLLGYQIADVDYSGLSDLDNQVTKTGDDAQATAAKIKNSLAPFDELNVVSSESSGSGTGTSASTKDMLSGAMDTYDMLKDYTSKMQDKIESLKTAAKGFLIGLGIVLVSTGLYKLVTGVAKWINTAGSVFSKLGSIGSYFTGIKTKTKSVTDAIGGTKEVATEAESSTKAFSNFKNNSLKIVEAFGYLAIIIAGILVLSAATGAIVSKAPIILEGADDLKQIFIDMLPVTIVAGAMAAGASYLGTIPIATVLVGITNLGLILVAIPAILIASGAILTFGKNTILSGLDVVQQICDTLSLKVLVSVVAMTAGTLLLGLVPIATVLVGITNLGLILIALPAILVVSSAILSYFSGTLISGMQTLSTICDMLSSQVIGAVVVLSAVAVALGLIPIATVLLGLANLAAILTGLPIVISAAALVIDGIQQLAKYFGDETGYDFIISAIDAVGHIVSAVAGAMGNAVAAFTDNAMKAIPNIATCLAQFNSNLGDNFDGSRVEQAANAAKAIGEFMATLGVASVTDAMTRLFTRNQSSLDTMIQKIPTLGTALKEFSENLGDFDGTKVTSAADAATALAEFLKKLPSQGIIAKFFQGDMANTLQTMIDKLPDLGKSLKGFQDNLGDNFDSNAVTNAANAATALADFSNALPTSGGFLDWLTGGKISISDFGDKLEYFGERLLHFYWYIKDVDDSKISSITNALSDINNLDIKAMTNKLAEASDTLDSFIGRSSGEAMGNNFGDGFTNALRNKLKTLNITYKLKNSSSLFGGNEASYTLKAYKDGGFPNEGDLFIANESGPELVTSLGGKTAVTNQDQTVEALTNAMVQGLEKIQGSNQKQNITIQLGNKTLYQGQIDYNNEQVDRYGSTKFIKV